MSVGFLCFFLAVICIVLFRILLEIEVGQGEEEEQEEIVVVS